MTLVGRDGQPEIGAVMGGTNPSGEYFVPEVMAAAIIDLREQYGVFIINIAMDDRHQYWGTKVKGQWDGTYPLIPHIDLTLTAAPEAVHWYRCEGSMACFFPEASDPDFFHPMPQLPKCHDVSLVDESGSAGRQNAIVSPHELVGIGIGVEGHDAANWGRSRCKRGA